MQVRDRLRSPKFTHRRLQNSLLQMLSKSFVLRSDAFVIELNCSALLVCCFENVIAPRTTTAVILCTVLPSVFHVVVAIRFYAMLPDVPPVVADRL
jgi:hypothetical protein